MPRQNSLEKSIRDFSQRRFKRHHLWAAESTVYDEISGLRPLDWDEIRWQFVLGFDTEAEAKEAEATLLRSDDSLHTYIRDTKTDPYLVR